MDPLKEQRREGLDIVLRIKYYEKVHYCKLVQLRFKECPSMLCADTSGTDGQY